MQNNSNAKKCSDLENEKFNKINRGFITGNDSNNMLKTEKLCVACNRSTCSY